MGQNTWNNLELPVLEEIERADSLGTGSEHDSESLVEALGLEGDRVDRAVELLIEAEYVRGVDISTMADARDRYASLRLTPQGARAVGRWPSPNPYENLVAVLDERIAEADDPEEASKLKALLLTVKDVGRGVATGVLTELVKQSAGL